MKQQNPDQWTRISNTLVDQWLRLMIRRRAPVKGAEDARWSAVCTAHDQVSQGDEELVEIALTAAQRARSLKLEEIAERCSPKEAEWVRTWPGEHYRLLAALGETLAPKTVVEIGTHKGHSALTLAAGSPSSSRVFTYDIIPWAQIEGTILTTRDLAPHGRIDQRVGDLGDDTFRASQLAILDAADLVFIDGPKDGIWEQRTLPVLLQLLAGRRRVVVLDDIRLLPMLQLWRDLACPKLDVTSLGHWSGTGLVFTA